MPDERWQDDEPVVPPLHPDDRTWRHPSEMGTQGLAPTVAGPRRRSRLGLALAGGVVTAALVAGALGVAGVLGGGTTADETADTAAQTTLAANQRAGADTPGIAWVELADDGPAVPAIVMEGGRLLTSASAVAANSTPKARCDGRSVGPLTVVARSTGEDLVVLASSTPSCRTAQISTIQAGIGTSIRLLAASGRSVAIQRAVVAGWPVDSIDIEVASRWTGSVAVVVDDSGAVVGLVLRQSRRDGARIRGLSVVAALRQGRDLLRAAGD